MKKILVTLVLLITLPAFANLDSNGLEKWDKGGAKTPFTEESNPRSSYEEVSAIQSQTDSSKHNYLAWVLGAVLVAGAGATLFASINNLNNK